MERKKNQEGKQAENKDEKNIAGNTSSPDTTNSDPDTIIENKTHKDSGMQKDANKEEKDPSTWPAGDESLEDLIKKDKGETNIGINGSGVISGGG